MYAREKYLLKTNRQQDRQIDSQIVIDIYNREKERERERERERIKRKRERQTEKEKERAINIKGRR